MAPIDPGWYWSRAIGQGWYGPFFNTQEMLEHAKRQGAEVVYSTCIGIKPCGNSHAVHVMDWILSKVTNEYQEKKLHPCP